MPDVNTTMYQPLQAPQQQQLGPMQVLQMIGQMQQNQNFKREMDSRQAVGKAYENSRNLDGSVNYPKLRAVAPTVGYNAPEAVRQATDNESASANLDTQYQNTASAVIGQLATNKIITPQHIAEAKTRLSQQKVPGNVISSIFGSAPNDQKGLHDWAVTHSNLARGPEPIAQGTAGPINEDTGVRPVLSAGAAARLQAATAPGGQTGMQPELPIGEKTFKEAGGPMKAAAQDRASTYGADIYPMQELRRTLHELGPTGVGPGTHELNTVKSFLQSNLGWMPGSEKLIGDPEKIASYEEATKYATQLAGSRAGMFGHGTDQAMATSLVGSPNTHISQLAGENLTTAIIGLKKMERLQYLEGSNVPVRGYGDWAGKWGSSVDPRAFMLADMNKKQRDTLQKSLDTPQKLQRFNDSMERGIAAGVIELPQAKK